jgi:hypothetical protein
MSKASEFAKQCRSAPVFMAYGYNIATVSSSGNLTFLTELSDLLPADALKFRDWLTDVFGEVDEQP